jgi:hypothetical protein
LTIAPNHLSTKLKDPATAEAITFNALQADLGGKEPKLWCAPYAPQVSSIKNAAIPITIGRTAGNTPQAFANVSQPNVSVYQRLTFFYPIAFGFHRVQLFPNRLLVLAVFFLDRLMCLFPCNF